MLDDVREVEAVKTFQNVLGARGRLLITTQEGSLMTAIGAWPVELETLKEREALELLAGWAGVEADDLPLEAAEVATECAGLPLPLALCGAHVRDGALWEDLRDALRAAELSYLDHPLGSIFKSMKVSVDALDPETARRYGELAVFFQIDDVPEAAILRFWRHVGGIEDRDGRQLLVRLKQKALQSRATAASPVTRTSARSKPRSACRPLRSQSTRISSPVSSQDG